MLSHVRVPARHGVKGLEILGTFSDYRLVGNDTHLFGKTRLVGRSAHCVQGLRGVVDIRRARREHYARNVAIEVAEIDSGCVATVPKG